MRRIAEEGTPLARPNNCQMVQSVGRPKGDSGEGREGCHYSCRNRLGMGTLTGAHAEKPVCC